MSLNMIIFSDLRYFRAVSLLIILVTTSLPVNAVERDSEVAGYAAGDDRYVATLSVRRRIPSEEIDGDVLRPGQLRTRLRTASDLMLETEEQRRVREKKQLENGMACCCYMSVSMMIGACLVIKTALTFAHNNKYGKQD